MKISELSRRTGVTVATIRFYIREGLLPAGEATAPNQAQYGESHVKRLDLIRAVRGVGGLGIEQIRGVLRAIDETPPSNPAFLAAAADALSENARRGEDDELEADPQFQRALAEVGAFLDRLGWIVRPEAAARRDLARAITTIRRVWMPDGGPGDLVGYARIAQELAAEDIEEGWHSDASPEEAVRYAVLGIVLGAPLFLALRLLAYEDRTLRLVMSAGGSPPKAAR
ncbi:MAG: MerR family transcriptional regulator [Chloroflexi bacterium]|nr:MerR family transcriptional regulator [Chloroflexota bacterium]